MRILHINDLALGARSGAEVNLSRLAEAQRRAGHEVLFFTPLHQRRGPSRLFDVWDPAALARLRETATTVKPDVLHFHNVIRELSPSVLAAGSTVPSVATIHDLRAFGGLEHHLPDPRAAVDRLIIGPITRRGLRLRVGRIIAVSEAVRRHLARYGFSDVVVARVPVPPPIAVPTPVEECGDVVFVGRLAPDKGPLTLVEAFEAVAHLHPASRLVVVGDGPQRAVLEHRARHSPRILLTGALDEAGVSGVMGRARLVVVPSIPSLRREGSSIVAAEAARHGRPVVTSDDPAVAEVSSGVGGQIVPAGDVAALASALDRWLGDGLAAAEAGHLARQAASAAYDVDTIRSEVDTVYESVMGLSSGR